VDYSRVKPVTLLHILEFSTDRFPQEPDLTQLRLCGDHSPMLALAVHTNISVVYKLASSSRSTGCLSLISVRPWHDGGRWQTIVVDSIRMKQNLELEKAIEKFGMRLKSRE